MNRRFGFEHKLLAILLAACALLYGLQTRRPAAPVSTPSEPAPQSELVLRIGCFAIGPDDEEPMLVDEMFLPVPGDGTATAAGYVLPATTITCRLTIGLNRPTLCVPDPVQFDRLRFTVQAAVAQHQDGSFEVEYTIVKEGPGTLMCGGSHDCRPGEVFPLDGPGLSSWGEGDWLSSFALGMIGEDRVPWGIDRWRGAIVETGTLPGYRLPIPRGSGVRDSKAVISALRAASWIPCPEGRDAFATLDPDSPARLMAGDAGAPLAAVKQRECDLAWPWRLRTIYLRYQPMRPLLRRLMNEEPEPLRPGPRLAVMLGRDAELRLPPPVGRSSLPMQAWVTGALVLGVLAAARRALHGRPLSLAGSATCLAWGMLLACLTLEVNGIDLTEVAAMPLLLAGILGFWRQERTSASWIRWSVVAAIAVVVGQVALLWEGSRGVLEIAGLAYASLPVLLLAATAPLVPVPARVAIVVYSLTVLLPALAETFLDAWTALTGGQAEAPARLKGWSAGFGGWAVPGLCVAMGCFWKLRSRWKAVAAATPVASP